MKHVMIYLSHCVFLIQNLWCPHSWISCWPISWTLRCMHILLRDGLLWHMAWSFHLHKIFLLLPSQLYCSFFLQYIWVEYDVKSPWLQGQNLFGTLKDVSVLGGGGGYPKSSWPIAPLASLSLQWYLSCTVTTAHRFSSLGGHRDYFSKKRFPSCFLGTTLGSFIYLFAN